MTAAIVGVLLAGCLWFRTEYYDSSSVWNETGLYARLPAAGSRDDFRLTAFFPEPAIPLASDNLTRRWGAFALTSVAESRTASLAGPRLRLQVGEDGTSPFWIHGTFPPSASEESIRQSFRGFVARVVEAEDPEVQTFEAAFFQSKKAAGYRIDSNGSEVVLSYGYQVGVENVDRLSGWFDALGGNRVETPVEPPSAPGPAVLGLGDWTFRFQVSTKQAGVSNQTGRFELTVDANDFAQFRHQGGTRLSDEEMEERSAARSLRWISANRR